MKEKKIAFVEPKIRFMPYGALGTYPLGILYVASALGNAGEYEVICFDEDSKPILENGSVEPFLLEADYVGISAKTATIKRAYKIADRLRELRTKGETNPKQKIIIGGIHATALPDEAIEHADVVVKGEGENVVASIIENNLEGIINGGRIENLDSLADPDYSLLHYKRRKLADFFYGRLASISTSRGCSYSCDFCSVWTTFGRKVRIESPEKTFNKMKALREKGFKRFFFHDDNFSDVNVKEYREALFNILLREHMDVRYTVQDRIDLLQDEDYVEKMKRSGCSMVMFSVECADEEFYREHRKELKIRNVEEGIRILRKYGINPFAFCMIDPEKPETTKKTLKLLRDLNIRYAQFSIPTPLPGTVLYRKVRSKISQGWEYFDGLTLVTERGEKMKKAAEHLAGTWKQFYSPLGSFYEIVRGKFTDATLRLYGWNIGRKIPGIQPDF